MSPLDETKFPYQAGFSLLTQLVLQAILNMAVVTALVPPKGIPHPLLSYGGSNLVVADTGFPGLVLRIAVTGIDNLTGFRSAAFGSAAFGSAAFGLVLKDDFVALADNISAIRGSREGGSETCGPPIGMVTSPP